MLKRTAAALKVASVDGSFYNQPNTRKIAPEKYQSFPLHEAVT
jgi:hypothetical protein